MPEYIYPKDLANEYSVAVMKYLQAFDPAKGKTDREKETYIHDYCLNNFSYDYTFSDIAHTILGSVMKKTAICGGIAKFVKLSFDYLGLKSLVVSGKAKNPVHDGKIESHAWNIVMLDGKTYHLDVTFDMTLTNKTKRYDYFNLPDKDIKKDHIITGNVPACTTVGDDYFSINSLVVHSRTEFENFIVKSLKQGKKTVLVKMMNMRSAENNINKIMEIALQQYGKVFPNSGVSVEMTCNPTQMVFEINFGVHHTTH